MNSPEMGHASSVDLGTILGEQSGATSGKTNVAAQGGGYGRGCFWNPSRVGEDEGSGARRRVEGVSEAKGVSVGRTVMHTSRL